MTHVTPRKVLEAWPLLEGSFHAAFGIDLSELGNKKSWRWFWVRVVYLLQTPNPLSQSFAPTSAPPPEDPPDWS